MKLGHWWRAYDDALNSPKLQRLPGEVFKGWFNLCCLASGNGGKLPPVEDIAFALRKRADQVEALLGTLRAAGLLDEVDGEMEPHNWRERQFRSDVSTDRVRRHRERQRNVSSAVSETPPDTETDPETDPPLREGGRARASAIASDWKPDEATTSELLRLGLSAAEIEREARKFRAHYRASGQTRADWHAAFAKWCERPLAEKPPPAKGSGVVALTPDMPSWEPWRAYYRDRGQTSRVALMDAAREQRKAFSVPSEWPPGRDQAA